MGPTSRFLRLVASVRPATILVVATALTLLVACGDDGAGGGATDTVTGDVAADGAGDVAGDVAGDDSGATDTTLAGDTAEDTAPDTAPPRDVPDDRDVAGDVPDDPDGGGDTEPGDSCDPNPCAEPNRGVCSPAAAAPGYTCACDVGYVEDDQGDCVAETVPCEDDADCDDGAFCNGAERCAPTEPGAAPNGCVEGDAAFVDDGDPCTTDTCDEEADEVVRAPHVCPSNAHCVTDGEGAPECVCDPGYEMNLVGLCRACEADPQEDNDTPGEAGPADPARGQLLSVAPNDPDWYVIDVCEGGTVTVDLYFDETLGDIDGFLYALDGETVLASGTSTTADESFEWVSDRDGQILVLVALPEGGCNRYSMTYEVDGCGPCDDDALEPNDDRATAPDVVAAVDEPLVLRSDSADWYWMYACVGQPIRLTVLYDTDLGDVTLRLYPEGADSSMAPMRDVPGGRQIDWVVTQDGAYYAVVEAEDDGLCIPYEIELERGVCLELNCENDHLEDNDTVAEAVPWTQAYIELEDRLEGVHLGVLADDPDWFAADLCAGENVSVLPAALSEPYTDGRVEIAVVAADGETVLDVARSQESTRIDYTARADESVYFRVTTTREVCDPYYFDIVRTGCQACEDDENEDDDTAATAVPIEIRMDYPTQVCGLDEDWMAVELCENSFPTIRAGCAQDDGLVEVALVGPDGETVIDVSAAPDGLNELGAEDLPGGTYYLRFRLLADAHDPGGSCSVRVDEACCPADITEPNDTQAEAAPMVDFVATGTPDLTIGTAGDDWYTWTVCVGSPLAITINNPADGQVDAVIVAADGETVLATPTTNAEGEFEFVYETTAALEDVFLRVTNPSDPPRCLQYGIRYTNDAPPGCDTEED